MESAPYKHEKFVYATRNQTDEQAPYSELDGETPKDQGDKLVKVNLAD